MFRRAGGVCGQVPYKNASPSIANSEGERVTYLTLCILLTFLTLLPLLTLPTLLTLLTLLTSLTFLTYALLLTNGFRGAGFLIKRGIQDFVDFVFTCAMP